MSELSPEINSQKESGRNPLLLIGGALILVAALGVLLFGGSIFGQEQAAQDQAPDVLPETAVVLPVSGAPLQVGDQPYEFVLQDLQGGTRQLSEFIGQPIIVNYWATWCGPCRIEMPELQAAYEKYASQGLVILALDQDESAPEVRDYFNELGLTFTPLLDVDSDTAQNYGLQGTLPASIFITPEGEISVIHRGVMTAGQLDNYLSQTIPGL